MLAYVSSFVATVFIGLQIWQKWQQKKVFPQLEESLLQLWTLHNRAELADFCKVTLQRICSTRNIPYCFSVPANKCLTEITSKMKILCDLTSVFYQGGQKFNYLKSSSPEYDWLVKNELISSGDKVCVICIEGDLGEEAEHLLFMVYGKTLYYDNYSLDTFVKHVSACAMRIWDSEENHIEYFSPQSVDFFSNEPDIEKLDAISMQKSLNNHFLLKTESDGSCVLFMATSINQIVCSVVNHKVLEYKAHYSVDDGFFAKAFASEEPIYLDNISENKKAFEQLKLLFNFKIMSALCVPVAGTNSDEGTFVVCLCSRTERQYSTADVSIINGIMSRSRRRLASLLTLQEEREKRSQCETMLKIAKNLFTRLGDVGQLLGEVIQEARSLTNAERCSVFLVDKVSNELVAKVFDGIVTADESLDPRQYDFENMNEVRISLDRGIAGHVATTGKLLNIVDAYSDPLFFQGIDNTTGFKTRNILCFPIKDDRGAVVGVAELCNKIKGHCFTSQDEMLAEKFAVFCGISLSHSLTYKAVEESGSRNRLANELVAYHMIVDQSEILENIPNDNLKVEDFDPKFDDFSFRPRDLIDDLKIKACIFMYQDLGLIKAYHISMEVLVHFLLMVRKGYRSPPYHNWNHAFSVMHHAYLLAKNLKLNQKLSDLEAISLLTASVCHDLDHRGTNNAFQINSQSLLANLYSSEGSVLERHHFAQAVCILSTEGCNIFEHMKRRDYSNTLALIKYLILATDVATHLKFMPNLDEVTENGLNLADSEHRKLLLSLCMTASDLSDQTKDWSTTITTSKLIYKEFFYQGDMEKRMGTLPAVINDREKACVPELQIQFMEHIALPAYRILATLFEEYEIVHKRVVLNLLRWRRVKQEFHDRNLQNRASLNFLTDDFARSLFEGIEDV